MNKHTNSLHLVLIIEMSYKNGSLKRMISLLCSGILFLFLRVGNILNFDWAKDIFEA